MSLVHVSTVIVADAGPVIVAAAAGSVIEYVRPPSPATSNLAAVRVPTCVPGCVTPPPAVAAVLEAAVRVSVPAVPLGTTLPNARSADEAIVIGRTTVAV